MAIQRGMYHSSCKAQGAAIIDMNEIVTPIMSKTALQVPDNGIIQDVEASGFVQFQFLTHEDGWHIVEFGPNFWEETGAYPHWVAITFKTPVALLDYALDVGPYGKDDTSRMPLDLILQASHDDKTWVDLDTRTGQTQWLNNEKRVYHTPYPVKYKSYRLYCLRGNNPDVFRLAKFELRFVQE
ncbi:MAG: hypothetical protein HQL13_01770 [Candidatus Omnitrophica bacterium]|nr:hypothetical protein [Candidatus Omnitrophota bacterium]